MGAGHCPWSGCTDWNVCNIHGEVRLASRYRVMLRPRTFSTFGTLPATLAPCQYSRIVLEEAHCRPTPFGKMPNIVGTLPKIPHLTLIGHSWPHTKLLCPKLAQKRHIFVDNWPWPLTLVYKKISPSRWRPIMVPNMKALGPTVLPFKGCDMRMDSFLGNIYGFLCWGVWFMTVTWIQVNSEELVVWLGF